MTRRDVPRLSDSGRARLVSLARRFNARHDAEDIVQEALLKLYRHQGEALRSTEAWLHTTVRHAAVDARRRAALELRVRARLEGEAQPDRRTDGDHALDVDRWVPALVANLGASTATALLLREAFDVSYDDLAANSPRSAVAWRQHLRRALVRVRGAELPHRPLDDDETQAAARCRRALATADPTDLFALLGTTTGAHRTAISAPSATSSSTHAQSVLALVGGRYVLALVRDGIVLCALPVGVNTEAFASAD